MEPKISYGGENVWLCRCENIEKRDEKLDDLLNNNNPKK